MCFITRGMIMKTRLFLMTVIIASLTFEIAAVTTNTFLTPSNPIPSPNSNAYTNAAKSLLEVLPQMVRVELL